MSNTSTTNSSANQSTVTSWSPYNDDLHCIPPKVREEIVNELSITLPSVSVTESVFSVSPPTETDVKWWQVTKDGVPIGECPWVYNDVSKKWIEDPSCTPDAVLSATAVDQIIAALELSDQFYSSTAFNDAVVALIEAQEVSESEADDSMVNGSIVYVQDGASPGTVVVDIPDRGENDYAVTVSLQAFDGSVWNTAGYPDAVLQVVNQSTDSFTVLVIGLLDTEAITINYSVGKKT